MTSTERNEIKELRAEMVQGFSDIREDFAPALAFYQRATGVIMAFGFIFAGVGAIAALVTIIKFVAGI